MAESHSITVEQRPSAGIHIGRYQVLATLGQGGMGCVYRARDGASGKVVALKVLGMDTTAAVAMFEREYHTLSSIDHPSVVSVYEFGRTENGQRYFTMELVEGEDLYSLAPVPWDTLCKYLREVAAALSLLHARGLVHRDVSPRNVRIDEQGRVRLLDFGALAAFGETDQLVGTPVCTAPEALRRMPLDARSDLYSLGATAYIGLTRKRPFPIKQWSDAENAWLSRPTSLQQMVPDLPAEMDELLMSLLSIDIRERPATAADVIERLEIIAGLREDETISVAQGHLSTPQLIGRERELNQLRQHLNHAIRGEGVAVAVEGAARVGRTRLTHDLCIDAQLAGAATVRVDGGLSRESGTLLRRLCRALLEGVPGEAAECLAGFPELAETIEELQRVGTSSDFPGRLSSTRDPVEHQANTLSAATQWMVEIANRRPLVIVIDDAHMLDHGSAGLLFGLTHACVRARMLVVFTLEDNMVPPKAVQQSAGVASRIKLRGLTDAGVEELVRSVFGEATHLPRLARWVARVAEGNPGHSLDLLTDLVARGTIRWLSGTWSLPSDLSQEALPNSLEEAVASRLAGLSPEALRLARLIALNRFGATLELCQKLHSEVHESDDVFASLDSLVSRQVTRIASDSYRITHEALRSALLAGVNATELSSLHRTIGEALLAESTRRGPLSEHSQVADVGTALQAGWHLLHGGEGPRGRDLLRTAGILLTRRGEGLAEAVPALEAALEAYEAQGRSPYERGYLMYPLCLAGAYIDFRLTYRYSEETLFLGGKSSGMELVLRLSRFLPGKLALGIGLLLAFIIRPFSDRRLTARNFREDILGFVGVASATLGTYSALGDAKMARRILPTLGALALFPKNHPAKLVHDFQIALTECAAGDYGASLRHTRETLAALTRPAGVPSLPEEARLQFVTGLRIAIGAMDAYRTDGRVHETLSALDRTPTALAKETAAGIRANYFAGRGEMKKSAEARERVDVLAAQGGSPWRQDVLMPRCLWWVEAQCEDSLALRRTVRQLEALTHDTDALTVTHAAAHAVYLADRGLAAEALTRYEPVIKAALREVTPLGMRIVGAYARVLRLAGRAHQSLALCATHLDSLTDEERELSCLTHGAQLERGLAMLAVGDVEHAAQYLDGFCEAQSEHDNPLLHTLSHRARAQVAIVQRDPDAFSQHMAVAQQWALRADYSALFGLLQRTYSAARSVGLTSSRQSMRAALGERHQQPSLDVAKLMSACRGPAQRQQTALDILVDHSQAAFGFLYLLESDGLRFAAPLHGAEPPDELLGELAARLAEFKDLDDETLATLVDEEPLNTKVGDELDADPVSRIEAHLGSPYRPLFIAFEQNGDLEVVGVLALVEGTVPLRPVDAETLQAVALGVYEAGDATAFR